MTELDDIYEELDNEIIIDTDKPEEKQLSELIDLEGKLELANNIVSNSLSVIDKANKVFETLADDVLMGKDSSTSSKEMLLKSLEVQNSANTNLIQLARVLDKKDSSNTTNVILGGISAKESGVDMSKLKKFK